jgi:hypothetical protein
LQLAIELCALHRCRRILQEEESSLCSDETRCIIDALGRVDTLPGLKFACCCHATGAADRQTARNLGGVEVRFFRDPESALQWLGAK